MDMSSGDWFSHVGMGDEARAIHAQMITSSQSEEDGFTSNHFIDPSADLYFNGMVSRSSSLTQNNINMNDNSDGCYFHPFSSSALGINVIPKEVKPELDVHMLHDSSTAGWSSCPSSSAEQFISFATSHQLPFDANYNTSSNIQSNDDHGGIKLPLNYYEDDDRGSYVDLSHQKQRSRRVGAMSLCSQEHVLAERKRREVMTQRFLALSSLIPGLNKTDKASILGDAAKYLKQLEEKVKLLEEQTTQRTVECAVLMKTRQSPNLDDIGCCLYDKNESTNPLLEIEARASNNNIVLIRIHSQKDQGLFQKVLNEIEKLHLTTLNCSTMPFGANAMNITIVAQISDGLCMTVKDLARHLRMVLEQFLCFSE